jgi:hypothetical protein
MGTLMKNELEGMHKKIMVTKCELLHRHLLGGAEENREYPYPGGSVIWLRFERGIS